MPKQKASVYIQDWMKFHPTTKQTPSDSYYLGLCKEIFTLIQKEDFDDLMYGLNDEDLKDFSCFITCYFEDVISKIGIWQAFTNAHNELYQKYLPFYKLDEYYHDEINPQDIQFIIWYFISNKFLDEYLSPLNIELVNLGLEIYEIFDREYEIAPENIKIKPLIQISDNETNYFKVLNILDWVFIDSYLFHFQSHILEKEIEDIIKSADDSLKMNIEAIADDARDYMAVNLSYNLLAKRGNFWLAQLVGNKHPLHNEISNLGKRKSGYFTYQGEDDKDFHFQHVASEKELKVTKKSVAKLAEFDKESNLFHFNLVKWLNEWWISGSYRVFKSNKDIIKEEKESADSIALFDDNFSEESRYKEQSKVFIEFNKNKRIAFFQNGQEMQTFMNDFVQFLNKSKKKNKAALNEIESKTENFYKAIVNSENLPANFKEIDCMVFFDKKEGLQIYFGLSALIPDKSNPQFDADFHGDILNFVFSNHYTLGFVHFLIENYPEMLNEYEKASGEYFMRDNIDFLLRFNKHYYFN